MCILIFIAAVKNLKCLSLQRETQLNLHPLIKYGLALKEAKSSQELHARSRYRSLSEVFTQPVP